MNEMCMVDEQGRMLEILQQDREPLEGEYKVPLAGYYKVLNEQRYPDAIYKHDLKMWVGVGEQRPMPELVYDLAKIERTYHDTAQPIATVSDVGEYFKVSLSRENMGKWETITFYRNKTMPIEQVEALYLERINEMFVFANAPEFFMYQQIETTIPPITEMIFKLMQDVKTLKGVQ